MYKQRGAPYHKWDNFPAPLAPTNRDEEISAAAIAGRLFVVYTVRGAYGGGIYGTCTPNVEV